MWINDWRGRLMDNWIQNEVLERLGGKMDSKKGIHDEENREKG